MHHHLHQEVMILWITIFLVYRSGQVVQEAFSVCTELKNVSLYQSANTCVSMSGSRLKNFAYQSVPVSPTQKKETVRVPVA